MDLGSVRLQIHHDHLVVEDNGGWPPYLRIQVNDYVIHLTPHVVFDESNVVVADYVYISPNYSVATFPLKNIVSLIKQHYVPGSKIRIDIMPVSKLCYVDFMGNENLTFTYCEDTIFYTLPIIYYRNSALYTSSHTVSVFDVILESFNTYTMNYLRSHLFNGLKNESLPEMAWLVPDWLNNNARYDYSKASSSTSIMSPISFYEKRTGVCVDYAVFTAAALLAGGARESYILFFDTDEGHHAVAGVLINQTLFILDQYLPVYEWGDYEEYVFKPTGGMIQVIKVMLDRTGEPIIDARLYDPNYFSEIHPDTYPSDTLPKSILHTAMREIASKLGVKYVPGSIYNYYIVISLDPFKPYNPLLHKQITDLLVNTVIESLRSIPYKIQSIWAVIIGDKLIVYIYGSPM